MAFENQSFGNSNNNYQPQFFLSFNSDRLEKFLEQKRHYEKEKKRYEKWLTNIQSKFDNLIETQKLIAEKYWVNVEKCCALESNKQPIPRALAAELEKYRKLLEQATAGLEEAYQCKEGKIAESEESLKEIEAELVAINSDIARAQRTAISLVTEDELVSNFLAKMGC